MRHHILGIAILLLAGIGGYFLITAHAAEKITNFPSKNTGIIAFGDSLVYGRGATKNNDFVSLLSQKIGTPIVNLGENGDTTSDALRRIDDVTNRKPKVVLVLFGGNDAIKGMQPSTTFNNLETIIQKIQAQGSIVVLLGIQGGLDTDPYAAQFKALAAKYHTAYVPNVLANIITDPKLMSDEVHPNDAGYALIAQKIYPVLKPLVQ